MKFKKQDMLDISNGDIPNENFEIVEQGDWVAVYKYQHRDTIFKYQDKFYSISESRSGSYYSEYDYDSQYWGDEVDATEVKKVEVITHEWRAI